MTFTRQDALERVSRSANHMGTFLDGSPEWHNARGLGLGGSEVAAVANIPGAFGNAHRLMLLKRGMFVELTKPEKQELFDLGHDLEPVIAKSFMRRATDWELIEDAGSWSNKERTWANANPDGLLYNPETGEVRVLELKFTTRYGDVFYGGYPPAKYVAQVRWYMWVLGLEVSQLACFAGNEGRVYSWTIPLNDSLPITRDWEEGDEGQLCEIASIERLLESAEWFMDLWKREELPPVDSDSDVTDFFMSIKQGSEFVGEFAVDDEVAQWITVGRALSKAGEDMLGRAKTKISTEMGTEKSVVWTDPSGVKRSLMGVQATEGRRPYLKVLGKIDSAIQASVVNSGELAFSETHLKVEGSV